MSKFTSTVNEEHVARVLFERRKAGISNFNIGKLPWRTPKLARLVAGSSEKPGEDTDAACQ